MSSPTNVIADTSTFIAEEKFGLPWWRNFALFSLAVVYPSTAMFKKLGWAPLIGYVICAVIGLYILLRYLIPAVRSYLNPQLCNGLLIACFGLLTAAMFLIYPQILEHQGFRLFGIQFGVSDSNDAYVATWKAMFSGKYPYSEKSFLGNPISPMPGALFLALPFYLVNLTSLQNVLWLAFFWLALGKYLRDFTVASLIMLSVMGICPNLAYTVIQGGDYMTNGIYVWLPALLLLHASKAQLSQRLTMGAAAALGLALSSRANFCLFVPFLFFTLWRLAGVRFAMKHILTTLTVFAFVTLPFFLYDPAHFSPLHTTGKLDLQGRFPHAAECVFFAGCLLATALGFFQNNFSSIENLCARMFFIQEFAVLCGFLLASLSAGKPELNYAHFALLSIFYGVFAFGPALFRQALQPAFVELIPAGHLNSASVKHC